MRFAEMREAGERYVCASATQASRDPLELGRELCQRHPTGAPLVLLEASARADARLHLFAPAGATVPSGGNGVCCATRFLFGQGPLARQMRFEVAEAVLTADLEAEEGQRARVEVGVGTPLVHSPVEMPMTFPDTQYNVTRVSVAGELYSVIFVHEVPDALVQSVGPQIEKHPFFAGRTSVVFARVNRRDDVLARVWRRGLGEVQACVGGAAALVVAGGLSGRTARRLVAHFPGDDLEVRWAERAGDQVFVKARVEEVATGEWAEGT